MEDRILFFHGVTSDNRRFTVAGVSNDNNRFNLRLSFSLCSGKDIFCKRIGRIIAKGRLMSRKKCFSVAAPDIPEHPVSKFFYKYCADMQYKTYDELKKLLASL